MPLFPEQSFEHTLHEISVNRDDPCELVRELLSNSYDAGAENIYIIPLYQRKGLLFFDDGCGLSIDEKDNLKEVLPYVAFFSIGKGTKTQGEQIGYKCQGSKLCFASPPILAHHPMRRREGLAMDKHPRSEEGAEREISNRSESDRRPMGGSADRDPHLARQPHPGRPRRAGQVVLSEKIPQRSDDFH